MRLHINKDDLSIIKHICFRYIQLMMLNLWYTVRTIWQSFYVKGKVFIIYLSQIHIYNMYLINILSLEIE